MTLAIDAGELKYIPANAAVHIASNTIFGAKSVEFIAARVTVGNSLRPGAHVAASAVSLEVNTLFQSLIDLLHKIDPVELNGRWARWPKVFAATAMTSARCWRD